MNDGKSKSRYRGADRRGSVRSPVAGDSGGSLGGALRHVAKIGGRHAAITNDLYSWHSYKSWADKVRGSWNEKK